MPSVNLAQQQPFNLSPQQAKVFAEFIQALQQQLECTPSNQQASLLEQFGIDSATLQALSAAQHKNKP